LKGPKNKMFAAAIPLAISGISALAGLLNNRGATNKQTSETNQSQHTDSTSMPQYDPKSLELRNMLINYYLDNMKSNDDVFGGYQREGLGEINRGADSAQHQMENLLASRGIQGPAAGAGLTAPLMAAQGQRSSFLNNIPLLRDQRQQDILKSGAGFLSSLPVGQHNVADMTGNSKTVGTQTQPSNMMGGLFGNLATTMAGLYGDGAFGGQGNGEGKSPTVAPSPSGINPNYRLPTLPQGSVSGVQVPMVQPNNPWTPRYY
jgi:hypothetical protein